LMVAVAMVTAAVTTIVLASLYLPQPKVNE
jgi:hypothetical protein